MMELKKEALLTGPVKRTMIMVRIGCVAYQAAVPRVP